MPHVSYFWDEIEDNISEEYDDDTGQTTAAYSTEPTLYGSVLSQDRSGEKRYFHFDGLGNTTELTDETGNVTDTRRYSAFGITTETAGTTLVPWSWMGRWGYASEPECTTLVVRRRAYSSAAGRWNSADPLGVHINPNVYSYCRSAPLTFIDPSGLRCKVCRWRRYGNGESIASLDANFFGTPVKDIIGMIINHFNITRAGRKWHVDPNSITLVGGAIGVLNSEDTPGHPKHSHQMAMGIIVNFADVCEDFPGTCRVRLRERGWAYQKTTLEGNWEVLQDWNGDERLVFDTVPIVYIAGDATLSNYMIADLRTPPTPECKKRIIVVDIPEINSSIASPPGLTLRRMEVDQLIEITSGNEMAGWITQRFELGASMAPPHPPTWQFGGGESAITGGRPSPGI